MKTQYKFDSKREAEKRKAPGAWVALENDRNGKPLLSSLHVVVARKIAREYVDGEPVWVSTVEFRPATAEELKTARRGQIKEELPTIAGIIAGGWTSTDPDTQAWVAKYNALKAEMESLA